MIYIEMSRDIGHGGGTWGFRNCIWAPTVKNARKRDSRIEWPFWKKVLGVREGDLILHLRGTTPDANFVGYSTSSSDGFETIQRPPNPGEWGFAQSFYRANLSDYVPFHTKINLLDLFEVRKRELNAYFDSNKNTRKKDRSNIFFVRQRGRLQCLNGAYLSDVDDSLLEALFGHDEQVLPHKRQSPIISVETASQISTVRSRVGQARFATAIKKLYGNRCCFPGCRISDPRFLVGSHIARWSDNEKLRGQLGNGLCLCLMHDKAFEIGIFTLDEHYRVFANPREASSQSENVREVIARHGELLTLSEPKPLEDAILEHWIRAGIDPQDFKPD